MTEASLTDSVGGSRPRRIPVGLAGIGGAIRTPGGAVGFALVCAVVAAAVLGPLLSPHDPIGGQLADRLQSPSAEHWLGTDLQGRDQLTRVLSGARITLFVAVFAVLFGFVVGCLLGSVGTALGGPVDAFLMRIVDVLLAFPNILLAVAVVAALGQGLPQLTIAIGVAQVGTFARLMRSRIVSVRELDFIQAARAVGSRERRVLLRHVLPNALTPVLVVLPLALASSIVSIAGLGFLGLGPPDPRTPEWGTMLIDSARYLRDAPYLVFSTGGAIVLTVVGLNLLGDALRESLDPRLRM